ncbi:DAK2 domain-containing protein [Streptomyces sp. JJ36]|uniref:DAK2 domain-containing protein n=1 Tax=Streptomyces sp. JJ36 TaxID=2736645 RepID=UPI001F015072|nr:DAK2 domain-containing protein [Streptomyces sp. JJ36]MCF6523306.1 DAK2 domain-containing protein [Streptomyces sp. JJ36]
MPHTLDPDAVRTWCTRALAALRRGRAEIDTINVFPVPDGDTGSNLCRTVEAAARALDGDDHATGGDALRAAAHGALLGACGNSGTILAQLLRGMAQSYAAAAAEEAAAGVRAAGSGSAAASGPAAVSGEQAAPGGAAPDGAALLRRALRRAADAAYEAVAHPVEGTMLTVAHAAADAADRADGDAARVAAAARDGARAALAATPDQLGVLARAGVVDAGGRGLVAVLEALADTLAGATATDASAPPPDGAATAPGSGEPAGGDVPAGTAAREGATGAPGAPAAGYAPAGPEPPGRTSPAYEVMYLLDAGDTAVGTLRATLDALGDSLVVIGGDGLWNVHVHTDDAGAAVEAGVVAGRPHRIRVTHLGEGCGAGAPRTRAVVAVVRGDGLAGLCAEAGATVVRADEPAGPPGAGGPADPGGPPGSDALTAALLRTHAQELVLLPNDPELHGVAARAAERARATGVRAEVIPTRAAVQGIAALAVHTPDRRFDEDVVAMTSAAGATRYGEVTVAERESWTTAGVCQAGDVLGLVEGDVAVIGADVGRVAGEVLTRMLAAGGELVTLVTGDHAPDGLAERLEEQVRRGHLGVDTVVYEGRRGAVPLLIGVE